MKVPSPLPRLGPRLASFWATGLARAWPSISRSWWQMAGVPPCVVISFSLKAFPGLGEGWAYLG